MIEYYIPIQDSADAPKLSKSQQDADANDEWRTWSLMLLEHRQRAVEARNLYTSDRPYQNLVDSTDDSLEGSANVKRPVLAQAVDSTIAQQHSASYPSDEMFFKVLPKNPIAEDLKEIYERHCEQRMSRRNFNMNSLNDRKIMQLTGVGLVWHPFVRETRKKVTYVPKTFLGVPTPGLPKKKVEDAVQFEGTDFIPVSYDDFLLDPLVDNIDEGSLIWRRWMSPDEVKSIKGFKNTQDLTSHYAMWHDEKSNDKREYYQDMGITPILDEQLSEINKRSLLMYEKWGDFHIDGKHYHNHVLIFSNDSVFHYFGPNPYDHGEKPFSACPYISLPGTMYGKSLAQDIIKLCHAQDTMINQALDAFSVTAQPAYTYLESDEALETFFEGSTVKLRSGEGIPVTQHDSIQVLSWDRGAIQEIIGMMQNIKEEIRESTGGVSYATGGNGGSDPDRTATEASILASGTETRFMLLIKAYEEYRLKRYMRQMFENDRQFMTAEVLVGGEDEMLSPRDIKLMDLVFDITGSQSIMNRAKEAQEYDMFLKDMLPGLIQNQLAITNGDIIEFDVPNIVKPRMALAGFKDLSSVMRVITKEEQQELQAEQLEDEPMLGQGLDEQILLQQALGGGQAQPMGGPQEAPGMAIVA